VKAEILHVWKALHYSADGLISTFRNETAFRLELIMAVVLIPIALILPLKGIEKVMLIGSVRGIVEGFPDMEDFCFHDSLRVA
jgi:diacylglycerol kinase (ATP)